MKANPQYRLIFGFLLVILITISVSFFGYQTLHARDSADELAFQSNTVISKIDEVLIGLVNMETGLRGYLLTGSSQVLEHYTLGKHQYEVAIEQLSGLTNGNPELQAHWDTVKKLESQWDQDWAAKAIQIRKDVDSGKVSPEVLSSHVIAERDESIMDSIRVQLADGKQAENTLLIGQLQAGRRADYWAYYVMMAGIVISLILGLITGVLLNRSNLEKTKKIELQHLLIDEREKERLKLARDLHDGPVQDLLSISFTIQGLLMENAAPTINENLRGIKTSLQSVVSELRASAMELRSPILAKFGLQKAIQADLENTQQQYPEMIVHFSGDDSSLPLPEPQQTTLFRIYQEAMRNIIRHAKASEISIDCQRTADRVVLTIQDNGSGFTLPEDWLALAQHGHFGLVGIRERTEAIGGQVHIDSHPGKGTRIRISVPA